MPLEGTFFFNSFIYFESERERAHTSVGGAEVWRGRERGRERERERERERIPSRIATVSVEHDEGFKLTNHEIMT